MAVMWPKPVRQRDYATYNVEFVAANEMNLVEWGMYIAFMPRAIVLILSGWLRAT